MTEKEIARSLQRAWQFVKAVGVDELFSDPSSIDVSDNFKKIALDTTATYEDLYLEGISSGQYNILLADYSFFQFGGTSQDNLRFAYYPNPFFGASREAISNLSELRTYVDEGVLDYDEYLHRVSEIRFTQHPPLVRYENAPSQYVDLVHPCSHLHIGHHSENRWPVRRILTPAAFSLIILKMFYGEFWTEGENISSGDKSLCLDDVLANSKQDCSLLPAELFSAAAERQFFFA